MAEKSNAVQSTRFFTFQTGPSPPKALLHFANWSSKWEGRNVWTRIEIRKDAHRGSFIFNVFLPQLKEFSVLLRLTGYTIGFSQIMELLSSQSFSSLDLVTRKISLSAQTTDEDSAWGWRREKQNASLYVWKSWIGFLSDRRHFFCCTRYRISMAT